MQSSIQPLVAEDAEPLPDLAGRDPQEFGDLLSGSPVIAPEHRREPLVDPPVLGVSPSLADVFPLLGSQLDRLHHSVPPPSRLRSPGCPAPVSFGNCRKYWTGENYEGKTCPLARFGHDRDGKTGCPIIVYGTLTDAEGRPVAVQVYPGNTGDPKTVPDQVETLTKRFGLSRVVLVGDRGMLTQTQIDVLKQHPGLGWISALRSGSIRRLLADGHLVRKDLEAQRLAEITSPEFPGERLVACYNPQLAEQRRQKRQDLLAATQAELEALAASVARPAGRPETAAEIGVRAGKIINHYKMAKHFTLTIRDGHLGWARKEDAIKNEEIAGWDLCDPDQRAGRATDGRRRGAVPGPAHTNILMR